MSETGRWSHAASVADLSDDEPLGVEVEGRPIALYRIGGEYYATSNICTHVFALLSDGFLEDCTIECPLHNGRFDVRTGKALTSPVETDIETYPVRMEGGDLQVRLSD